MSAEADAGSEADTAALVSLARRRIILGVSGRIAADQAVEVCGRLAGGDMGEGGLADPARIVAAAAEVLSRGGDLVGLRILVTAGGTREPIDPVRYLGNRSSGKMGHAIVDAAAARGAIVTLVTTT